MRILLLATLALLPIPALADDRADLSARTCATLDAAVAALPPGPVLLPSYPRLDGPPPTDVANLKDVAFTYDNALAVIALFACERPASARRIADALVQATTDDPEHRDGRVRNAYAAGAISSPMKLPGYWDAGRNAWNQDAYQASVATGNVAWAAIALLEAHRRTRHAPYLDAAKRALGWARANAFDPNPPAGFIGGFFVDPAGPIHQGWKSTEHNVDMGAALSALDRAAPDPDTKAQAATAREFVAAQWDAGEGRFLIGTTPDGRTPDRERSGLDAQIWPLIAWSEPPKDWMRALAFVDAAHGVAGGYGYNRQPDGIWTEGTAQVAAVFVLRGLPARAAPLWPLLRGAQAEDGWLYATPLPRVRTGLAIGPTSITDDFYYYRLPHLGATAWAALAAKGVNPFGVR